MSYVCAAKLQRKSKLTKSKFKPVGGIKKPPEN